MNDYIEDWGANGKIENFLGADSQSAVRWLRRFTRERVTKRDGTQVSAPVWLEEVFKRLFLNHFQTTADAPFDNSIPQIQALCHAPNESLLIYHRRASGILIAAGGKDITDVNLLPLEPSVRSILDFTIDRYINGLVKMSLRLRRLRYTAVLRRSVKGAYMMAEAEMKQMGAEKDLLHSLKAEKELELWKRVKTTNGATQR